MSHFRRGHYRTNADGTTFWVQKHVVSRRSVCEVSRAHNPLYMSHPNLYKSNTTPELARPINIWNDRSYSHNARCPVCKQDVFFYQNEHGSAVFFDECGPPWPKHPCTTNALPLPLKEATFGTRTVQPAWQTKGWKPLRSAKLFQTDDGHELAGYSRGIHIRFSVNGLSVAVASDIKQHKVLWHYRIADERQDCTHIAGAYTQSYQFHELPVTLVKTKTDS